MNWIPINPGCDMPNEGDEVLVTIRQTYCHGNDTDVKYEVDIGFYHILDPYILCANNVPGGFGTMNGWDECQSVEVIAWMPKPDPYKVSTL